jgi:hypothetical protein
MLMSKKWKIGIVLIFILILVISISGCSTLAEYIPLLASPTTIFSPTPTYTITPTKTQVIFSDSRWTNTPEGQDAASFNATAWASPPIPSPTLRPSWTPLPSNTLIPTWTPSFTLTPSITPTPTSTVEVYRFLFEQFSDPNHPWLQSGGENWSTSIQKGIYAMEVTQPYVEITSSRSWLRLAEVRIEADVTLHSGEGYFGFNCREGTTLYHTAFIGSDGHYGLGRTQNGKVEFLIYAPAAVINSGQGATNHLRAECRGKTIALWVNGVELVRQEMDTWGMGFVGMMVGTRYDTNQIRVHFDNLQVWGPETYSIITNTPSPETETPEPTPEG